MKTNFIQNLNQTYLRIWVFWGIALFLLSESPYLQTPNSLTLFTEISILLVDLLRDFIGNIIIQIVY